MLVGTDLFVTPYNMSLRNDHVVLSIGRAK